MKKLSIERIGKRGSVVMLIAGLLCLAFGIFLQVRTNDLPFHAVELTATITAFEDSDISKMQTTTTLVSYTFDGKEYQNIPLGQFEGSWKIGDTLKICLRSDEPTKIWTRTMQYRGIFYMLFSASFLLVSIYKLLQFRKKKGETESDIDDCGEEKFKVSSIIIPMAAGLPLTVSGILYWIMEHSILGVLVFALGFAAVLTGAFSVMDFIRYKRDMHAAKVLEKSKSDTKNGETAKAKKE